MSITARTFRRRGAAARGDYAPGYASLPACRRGERRIDRRWPPGAASLASSNYRLQSRASDPKPAAGLQWVFRPRLHAGSDAYPGISAGVNMKVSRKWFIIGIAIALSI